jgi:hypothetical protein
MLAIIVNLKSYHVIILLAIVVIFPLSLAFLLLGMLIKHLIGCFTHVVLDDYAMFLVLELVDEVYVRTGSLSVGTRLILVQFISDSHLLLKDILPITYILEGLLLLMLRLMSFLLVVLRLSLLLSILFLKAQFIFILIMQFIIEVDSSLNSWMLLNELQVTIHGISKI